MKVKDLIARLGDCDPDAEVGFAYDYGDRSHTTVIETARVVEDDTPVVYSDYHRKLKPVDEYDAYHREELHRMVVIASGRLDLGEDPLGDWHGRNL